MCVKFAQGSCIVEEDLPLSIFKRLAPSLAHAQTLILNGIGEPLLHPELKGIISFARANMPEKAVIGFQSNGLLLNEEKSLELLSAGLSTVCLSLDGLEEAEKTSVGEHSVTAVSKATRYLLSARKQIAANHFKIGLETVLTKQSIQDFPRLVQWAADHGVDYVIATHLLQYHPSKENANLFNPNPAEAVHLFDTYKRKANSQGINIANGLPAYLKFIKNEDDQSVVQLFQELQQEARDKDIRLHVKSLIDHSTSELQKTEQAFIHGCAVAEKNGIELILPNHLALSERACPFIADEAVFVAANGAVMPCHFLWHTYSCWMFGEEVQVQKRSFGTIKELPLEMIWRSPEYVQFRCEARQYEYAPCWSCTQGPCATLVNDNDHFANDCYGSQVPCGHCQWNLGGIHCL
jgi:putative metalloenzyme radical SAM/SPASM domain maturase